MKNESILHGNYAVNKTGCRETGGFYFWYFDNVKLFCYNRRRKSFMVNRFGNRSLFALNHEGLPIKRDYPESGLVCHLAQFPTSGSSFFFPDIYHRNYKNTIKHNMQQYYLKYFRPKKCSEMYGKKRPNLQIFGEIGTTIGTTRFKNTATMRTIEILFQTSKTVC